MSLDPIRTISVASGHAFDRVVDLQPAKLPDLIADLLRDARRAAQDDRLEAERRVQEAVDLVQREGQRLIDDAHPAPKPCGLLPWQVRRIDAYIAENLDRPIRVSDLARIAKLSASYFSRVFAQTYGCGAREHIIERRLERAREMMLRSSEPLGQIAAACGFADQAHLSTRFRKAFATSPHAWRRQHLSEPRPSGAAASAALAA